MADYNMFRDTDYNNMRDVTHFWEFQISNRDNGNDNDTNNDNDNDNDTIKWERYDPSIQAQIFEALEENDEVATLEIDDTDFEMIFDHENGNHRVRDVNNGSECDVRKTPEEIVEDWNVFKAMFDVSKVTKLDLRGQYPAPEINDHDAHEFLTRLADCTSLWYLDLSSNNLTDVFGVAFGKAVATNRSLSVLDLGDNQFGEETGVEIGAALTTNTSLHSLFLSNNTLSDASGVAFGNVLATNTSLRELNLGENNLGGASGVSLAKALATNTTLRALDLCSNGLGDEAGVALGNVLANNTSLRELTLSDTNSGSASGVAFAKALTINTSLRALDFYSNGLSDEAGVAFGKALATNVSSLRDLNLGINNLGDASGVAFAKALTTNKSLRALDLSNNNLGDEAGVALGEALTTNTSLRELHLTDNTLGDTSGVAFAKALATNTSLWALHVLYNSLGDASGVAFGKALATNTSLKTLDLNHNNTMGEASGVALVNGLSQNSTLIYLDVHENSAISPATQAKIKFALSPELNGLLNDPSVSPTRIPVCVVGFDNVGKTELVNTWHRTTTHDNPHLDPEETAEAKSDDERTKTSGISIKPITLKPNRLAKSEPPTESAPTIKRRKLEVDDWTVEVTVWDFAGHGEYYVSHKLVSSGCRDALFVVLFRIDRLLHPDTRKAEIERLFFWLRFVTTMRSIQRQQQQHLPTVFIGGSFRPIEHTVFDIDTTMEWTDWVLREAKLVFGSMMNIPQQKVHLMDCRKCHDPHVVALRTTLAEAVEATRIREDRKIPPICETARGLLHHAKQDVTSKLASYEQHLRTYQSNPNASVTPLSWVDTVCGPIMSRAHFEEHVLGELEVKADDIGVDEDELHFRWDVEERKNPVAVPSIAPKSKQLLQIITSYLHDVGDILWFDVDGLRNTVILTPDLFCSKIIGAILRPDAPGFSIDAVHGNGGLVPKAEIVATFKRALGIDDTHVDAALAILCQLGLCHRHQDDSEDSYLFPGALAAASYRRPEWFGPLSPGQHFVVGRRFTLVDPTTTIFAPGCMSEVQVWALGRYEGSMIWRDGIIIPYTASQTLAEAGVQLHHPYSSSQDGDKCARVSMSSITLVVRGSDATAQSNCLQLLKVLCEKIRATSGGQLVEEALPPNEVAKSSTNNSNMLDVTCPGLAIHSIIDPAIRDVVVGGKLCAIDNLRFGSFVDIPHPVQSIPVPRSWTWEGFEPDFEPVRAQNPNGGAHLLVEIPRDHADFTRIETNMRRSMPTTLIHKIQRVQNRALWNKYFLARSDIAKECDDGSPREIEAWHSTGTTDPWLICSDWKAGFDVNRSGIGIRYAGGYDARGRPLVRDLRNFENKSYGTGVYLAEHSIYSDTILPHIRPISKHPKSQDRQIILAKVTLGRNFDHGTNIPDWRLAIEPEGYHSISGTEGNLKFILGNKSKLVAQGRWSQAWEELIAKGDVYGRQYVVHRSNQVYPAYLVTYTTKNKKADYYK